MQNVMIIINQIVILSIIAIIGFIAGKSRYLHEHAGVVLSGVVVRVTAPLLIVTTMANYDFTPEVLRDGVGIFFTGLVSLLFAMGVGAGISKILPLSQARKDVFTAQSVFGNVIFLAYPLLTALFGEKGVVYAIFFNLASDAILWTIGVYLLRRHSKSKKSSNPVLDGLKHLINGNIIAFVIGLIFIIFGLKAQIVANPTANVIYQTLFSALNPLGKTTIYLSMLFIGLILANVRIKSVGDLFKRYPLFILSILKLMVIPVLVLLVIRFIPISSFAHRIVVLQLAMPCATIVPALAAQHDADFTFATECVFVSTLMCIVTLPLLTYITNIFLV